MCEHSQQAGMSGNVKVSLCSEDVPNSVRYFSSTYNFQQGLVPYSAIAETSSTLKRYFSDCVNQSARILCSATGSREGRLAYVMTYSGRQV